MSDTDSKTEQSLAASDNRTNNDAGEAKLGADFGTPKYDFEYWKDQIAIAQKAVEKFHERGRKTLRRYIDEREANDEQARKYNLFWANTGVLMSALYANPPKPTVKRTWDDYTDDIGRVAAEILERLLNQGLQRPRGDMDAAFSYAMEDRLVPGLGQVWIRYNVETKEETVPGTTIKYEKITNEEAVTDWIYWEDFLWAPCRVWEECRWVARLAHMTKESAYKRFGAKAEGLSYTDKFENIDRVGAQRVTPEIRPEATSDVWEIWSKTDKMVYWVSTTDMERLLDKKEDPMEIEGFFPCPKPLMGTHTTSNLCPRPDYFMVKDQYEEVDTLNTRIGWLTKACKAAGVYDKTAEGIQRLFEQGTENSLIPVDNWAMFAEKGGVQGQIDWIPIEQIVKTITALKEYRQDCVAQIYELTGISDIMRGATNARETLGAQQLKAQYGSVRLQFLQGKTAEFVTEAMRIKADIISKHWQPETIVEKSLIMQTPKVDHQKVQPAIEMLKNTPIAQIRLEIESDTMSIPDYALERASRMEYVTAMGQLISQSWQAIQAEPRFAPLVLQTLQWAAAGFKNARTMEGVLDQAVEETQKAVQEKMNQPPPPDPEIEKLQMEMQMKREESQAKLQAKQMEGRIKAMEAKLGMEQDRQQHDQEMAQDEERHIQEMDQTRQRGAVDREVRRAAALRTT
jgi:hypothetical protein